MTLRIAALDPGASLRPYQEQMDAQRRACPEQRRVVQAPTGSGKSKLIEAAAAEADRLLVLAHAEWRRGW